MALARGVVLNPTTFNLPQLQNQNVRDGYIYLTTCLINGHKYIGKRRPQRPNEKWYLGSGNMFRLALAKHGKENFEKQILVRGQFNDALLNDLERHYIQLHAAVKRTDYYNLCAGGSMLQYNIYENPAKPKYSNIHMFDKNGVLLKRFDSAKNASDETGLSVDIICRCIRLKSIAQEQNVYFQNSEVFDLNSTPTRTKPVYLFDKNGELVQEFQSRKDCAKFLKTETSHISASVKKRSIIFGFFVSDKKEFDLNVSEYNSHRKKVDYNLTILRVSKDLEIVETITAPTVKWASSYFGITRGAIVQNLRKFSFSAKLNSFLVKSQDFEMLKFVTVSKKSIQWH